MGKGSLSKFAVQIPFNERFITPFGKHLRRANSTHSEGRPFFFQKVKIRRDSADTPVDYKIFSHRKHIKAHLAEDPPRAIGYLDYGELWKFRGHQYQSRRRRSGEKVLDEDSGPYTPLSWRKDPFLFFILLGIAQTHRLKYQGASSNKTFTVC
jgi:hypothetical protein